ncbi:ankyrin repeat protein, partial [Setomelanomma holmii]
ARNNEARTPLHIAAKKGDVDLGKALLDHCAEIDAQDANGTTALAEVCHHGHAAFARMLLVAGAKAGQPVRSGHTSLHSACAQGHKAVVHLLLSSGADPNGWYIGDLSP